MANQSINNHQGRIHGNILERVFHENSGLPPTPGISKHLSLTVEPDVSSVQQSATAQELGKDSFCLTRVVKSKINFQMLPYKLFYLFTDGAMACVVPYRSLFFKQLGLSPSRIGIISASKPFASFVANPMAGLLADRFGKRRLILVISTLVWIALMVMLGFVPPPIDKCNFNFSCSMPGSSIVMSKRSSQLSTKEPFPSLYFLQGTSVRTHPLSSNLSQLLFRKRQHLRNNLNSRAKRDDRRFISETPVLTDEDQTTLTTTTNTTTMMKIENTSFSIQLKNEECLIADQSWRYDQASLNHTFITIIIITCVTYCAFGPAMRLADTSTLNTLSESNVKDITDYGWHRSFGGLGWAIW